jgi:hypothetical protein
MSTNQIVFKVWSFCNTLRNLPGPDVLAEETAENLESMLGSFGKVARRSLAS